MSSAHINTTAGVATSMDIILELSEQSYSVADNTSVVKITLYLKKVSSGNFWCGQYANWSLSGALTTSGSYGSGNYPVLDARDSSGIGVGATFTMYSGTITVAHNSDGTGSCSVSGSWSGSNNCSGSTSDSLTLTTIPRKSSISAESGTIDSAHTITINKASSSFTHTLTYKFGTKSGTIATKTSESTVSWTFPTSLISEISNANVGTGTIYCETFNGDTSLGTTSCSFAATIKPTNFKSLPTTMTIGQECTIELSSQYSTIVNTLEWTCGSGSGTIQTKSTATSIKFTPPASMAQYFTDAATATLTFKITSYNGTSVLGSSTSSSKLSIPASTLSITRTDAIDMGTENDATVTNPCSEYLTCEITWSYVNGTGTWATAFSATSKWNVSDFAQYIPTSTSGTVTITATTKRGTATVSTNTATFTLNLPESIVPTISSAALSDSNGYYSDYLTYIQGYSKLKGAIEATPGTGATISYYSTIIQDVGTYTGSSFTMADTLSVSGSKTVTFSVGDSRGRKTTTTITISIAAYESPKLTGSCFRCTADGTEDDTDGTYIKLTTTQSCSSISVSGASKSNALTVTWYYKTSSETSYTTGGTISGSTYTGVVGGGNISPDHTYNIRVKAQDNFKSTLVDIVLSSAAFVIDVMPDGKGIAFGKVAEKSGYIETPWIIDVGGLAINGEQVVLGDEVEL